MNYLEYFELTQEAFSNAPVTRFFYNSPQHSQALMKLLYAVESMKGLAVLIGDIGAGKTTLARRLLDSLSPDRYESALLVIIHAGVTAGWVLKRIAGQIGVKEPSEDKIQLLTQVYNQLLVHQRSGKRVVVLIDEAQMLRTKEIMEEFRGLLNLEVSEHKLITFVFFGLPEIDDNLKLDPPLEQRVAVKIRLESFSEDATEAYIKHRLKLAGAKRMLFTQEAVRSIFQFSSGIPRLINTLSDNALFEGFILKVQHVDTRIVENIAVDLGLTSRPASRKTVGNTAAVKPVTEIPEIRRPAAGEVRAAETPWTPPGQPIQEAPDVILELDSFGLGGVDEIREIDQILDTLKEKPAAR